MGRTGVEFGARRAPTRAGLRFTSLVRRCPSRQRTGEAHSPGTPLRLPAARRSRKPRPWARGGSRPRQIENTSSLSPPSNPRLHPPRRQTRPLPGPLPQKPLDLTSARRWVLAWRPSARQARKETYCPLIFLFFFHELHGPA